MAFVALPLFEAVALTLDYPNSQIRIQTGVLPAADNCTIFPLQRDSSGLLSMTVNVAGNAQSVLVDSGSNAFVRLPAEYSGLAFVDTPTTSTINSVTGSYQVLSGCLASGSVSFGCISYSNPCVVVGGTLSNFGGQAMMPYAVTIDQQNSRIRFN